jgi:hypothetical protein
MMTEPSHFGPEPNRGGQAINLGGLKKALGIEHIVRFLSTSQNTESERIFWLFGGFPDTFSR